MEVIPVDISNTTSPQIEFDYFCYNTTNPIPANILFFTISAIQNSFGFLKLNPDDYYVESIPFILDPLYIISLNLIFILISSIILSITFGSITRFTPKLNINS